VHHVLCVAQAPSEGPARGVVVEASNTKAGPQVALIVRSGRLRVGDIVVVGTEYGKVRAERLCQIQLDLTETQSYKYKN
jgi:translation initiation factor IF-2